MKFEDFSSTVGGFKDIGGNPIIVWKPVVERNFGQDLFLKDTPINLFRSGNFSNVPVMAGVVRDEFTSLARSIYFKVHHIFISDNFIFYKFIQMC